MSTAKWQNIAGSKKFFNCRRRSNSKNCYSYWKDASPNKHHYFYKNSLKPKIVTTYFLTEHEILTRGRIVGTAIATSNTAAAVRTRRIATRIGRMPWFRGCQLQHRLPLFLPFRLVQNQTKLSVVQMRLEAPSSVEGGPNITTGQQRVKSFT